MILGKRSDCSFCRAHSANALTLAYCQLSTVMTGHCFECFDAIVEALVEWSMKANLFLTCIFFPLNTA
ncbi:MAG TPA: hypothetical protein DCL15_22455 [Chloroflexi bacterium]|nr:hypothetical protein [Chloroflexota bacterium]